MDPQFFNVFQVQSVSEVVTPQVRDALFTGQFKDIEFKTTDKMVELIIQTSKYAGNKVS